MVVPKRFVSDIISSLHVRVFNILLECKNIIKIANSKIGYKFCNLLGFCSFYTNNSYPMSVT